MSLAEHLQVDDVKADLKKCDHNHSNQHDEILLNV